MHPIRLVRSASIVRVLGVVGLLFFGSSVFGQTEWALPSKEIGTATLTHGLYPEQFSADTLRWIGCVLFNTVTRSVVLIDEERVERSWFGLNGKEKTNEIHNAMGTNVDFGDGMYDPRVGRWLSMDPMASKYPGSSPYLFGANSPIITVDPNGGENVVYLVLLNPNSTKLSKKEAGYIAALTNARLMSMGLNTRVQVFEGKVPFDPRNLDQTDSYVMFGSKDQILKATGGPAFEDLRNAGTEAPDLNELGTNHPEESRRNGAGVFVDESALGQWATKVDERKPDLGSLVVAHGMGHNAGVGHRSGSFIMWDGGEVSRMLDQPNYYQDERGNMEQGSNPNITKSDDLFGLEKNWDYAKAIKERFGSSEAKDNYSLNDGNRQKQ